jgi:hypothetical protein
MDADKNKKLRRTAIAARLPRDKLPSVIIGLTQRIDAAAVARAPRYGALPHGTPEFNPPTARKRRRLPHEQ